MISENLAKELSKQINRELEAAYLYFSMSVYCDDRSLDGISKWMRIQAEEEIGHGMKIYNYLSDLGCAVELMAIPAPKSGFESLEEVFSLALKNEKDLAECFNRLSGIALDEKDNMTYNFLKWFLDEQVEEISLVSSVLDKVKLVGEDGNAILMLNEDLGRRTPEAAPA